MLGPPLFDNVAVKVFRKRREQRRIHETHPFVINNYKKGPQLGLTITWVKSPVDKLGAQENRNLN